jgi:hypothetical protein
MTPVPVEKLVLKPLTNRMAFVLSLFREKWVVYSLTSEKSSFAEFLV